MMIQLLFLLLPISVSTLNVGIREEESERNWLFGWVFCLILELFCHCCHTHSYAVSYSRFLVVLNGGEVGGFGMAE